MGRTGKGGTIPMSISLPLSWHTIINKETTLTKIQEFDKLAERDGLNRSGLVVQLMEEYYAKHNDGNPSNKITMWLDNPLFKAYPAFFRTPEDWKKYLEGNDNKKELLEIADQARMILHHTENKLQHGTTNVRVY